MTTDGVHSVPREVCFLIGADDQVIWSDVSDSPVALPDSRTRWEAIWENREQLTEIAHSHPVGPTAFSSEDTTTMQALTAALGRGIRFSVVSAAGMIVRDVDGNDERVATEPPWTVELRARSGMARLED
jgi:hypothetical protein